MTSTTQGIALFLYELEMRYAFGSTADKTDLASVAGQGSSTFVTGVTGRPWCLGSVSLDATAKGFARWPNGVGGGGVRPSRADDTGPRPRDLLTAELAGVVAARNAAASMDRVITRPPYWHGEGHFNTV